MNRVGDLIEQGTAALAGAGVDDPRAEARLLLAHASGLSAAAIFGYPEREADAEAAARFRNYIGQRRQGVPAAHITGSREFWSLPLRVTPATLVPRPDTETVVELALDDLSRRRGPSRILDLGTGTGCLLLALLSEFPAANGIGLDVSEQAISVAASNAAALELEDRCSFESADFADAPAGPFELIVSNPPYIPSGDIAALAAEVRDHDPRLALDGGADGLDAYRTISGAAPSRLAPDGLLILEIGIGQAAAVTELAEAAGLELLSLRKDLGGIERALSFCKKSVGIPGAAG